MCPVQSQWCHSFLRLTSSGLLLFSDYVQRYATKQAAEDAANGGDDDDDEEEEESESEDESDDEDEAAGDSKLTLSPSIEDHFLRLPSITVEL